MSITPDKAQATAEVITLVVTMIARVTSDVPSALSLYDNVVDKARDELKKNWDPLRTPVFSKNFDAGIARLVATMREMQSGAGLL